MSRKIKQYLLYGLTVASDFGFSYPLIEATGAPSLRFVCREARVPAQLRTELAEFSAETLLSLTITPTADGYQMRFDPIMCFQLTPSDIRCDLYHPTYDFMVELHLLGVVLAFWLAWQKRICLHAAAVGIEGKTVAWVGDSGTGKSSLAASFVQLGVPLVTDDILAISDANGYGGFALMRLWPLQAARFWPHQSFEPVHPVSPKVRVPIPHFCAAAQPLGAIFVLTRREEETEILCEQLDMGEALFALARYEFSAEWQHLLLNRAEFLKQLANLVRQVPVYRLIYPSGYDQLAAVRQRIYQTV